MGSQIASKNLYDLLGNDPELDPDREPEPPTKAIDKPVQRSGKRNDAADASRPAAGGRAGGQDVQRRADLAGDRPNNNRAERRDDGLRQDRHPDRLREPREHRGGELDGRGRGRGGRGGRGRGRGEYRGTRTARDDRHNHSGIGEHDKQAAHGWGAETGAGEWADEKAGDAIAQAEKTDEPGFTPDTDARDPAFSNGPDATAGEADAAPAEEEDKTKSYEQYLAELAEKRLALGSGNQEFRKANEGSKQKFPEGTAFSRNPEEENFFAGSGGKAKKTKERTEKNALQLDGQYYAPVEQEGGRGGRGGRGGSRGGSRGDREGGRGRGEGRGRGGRGRGEGFRGGPRGGGERGGAPRGGGNFNAQDSAAFPALGA